MTISNILQILTDSESFKGLLESIGGGQGSVSAFGVGDAIKPLLAAALHKHTSRALLYIASSAAAAKEFFDEVRTYDETALLFPSRELPLTGAQMSANADAKRIEVLSRLARNDDVLVITSAEAMMQRLPYPEAFALGALELSTGEQHDMQRLSSILIALGYERTARCEEKGQFTLRGGILDIYPVTAIEPARIEFFDDEIDIIRGFDPISQRSTANKSNVFIAPAGELPLTDDARHRGIDFLSKHTLDMEMQLEALKHGASADSPLLRLVSVFYPKITTIKNYLPKNCAIIIDQPDRMYESAKTIHAAFLEACAQAVTGGFVHAEAAESFISPSEFIEGLDTPYTLMLFSLIKSFNAIRTKSIHHIDARSVPRYMAGFEPLAHDIKNWRRTGYSVLIFAGSHSERIADGLMEYGVEAAVAAVFKRKPIAGELLIISQSLPRGFELPERKLAVVSESELFGSKSAATARPKKYKQLDFGQLSPGDLIVHDTHGIGRFEGVKAMEAAGVVRDYLNISYAAGDVLYIPTDQLDRVQKYIGSGDEAAPKLSKLGTGEWQRTVSRAREGVKALAFDLMKLYGERSMSRGYSFSPDTPWQRQLEAHFPYEETPDQITSIAQVKADMESPRVMDRLLCGDVGYGKTEVAIRAAFKAVQDGKQVAVLVPTTVLAQQHFNTFSARLDGFPVSVEMLSRFVPAARQKEVEERIKKGKADIVIGTHRLLSKNVRFFDLGLLIVDEEQRFGVGHKEQIKNIKKNVDVLTLSATPIPRTLHMSMTGIRDMSVIETPPEQRYPVQTYVLEYSEALVREAIMKELSRGGQVYFVYNKVRDIDRFGAKLSQLVPEARIMTAHGQMNERVLERTMLEFIEGNSDVLLCSTIIENGLDVPNANTLIVYESDNLGLSQLYQLRGRVGRSTRLGYAYFTFTRNRVMTEIAQKRLNAIREFTQFGSGFKIAMQDLELRGAGNLLGAQQSGHMLAIGYELYCRLMEQEVRELKGEAPKVPGVDCTVDIPLDASIPGTSVPNEGDRLSMYRRISSIASREDVMDVQDEYVDRYGVIPQSAQNLMEIALIKSIAGRAYIQRLSARAGELKLTFVTKAPLDGLKLLAVCAQTGARIMDGESTCLLLRDKKHSAESWLEFLPQFVYTILDCIDTDK